MYPFFESIIESTLCVMSTENLRNLKEVMGDLTPQGIPYVGVKINSQANGGTPAQDSRDRQKAECGRASLVEDDSYPRTLLLLALFCFYFMFIGASLPEIIC